MKLKPLTTSLFTLSNTNIQRHINKKYRPRSTKCYTTILSNIHTLLGPHPFGLFQKKKMDASGKQKFRIVIDYRKLNEKTVTDKFPISDITDILDKLGKSNYFTTIDLTSGFHQIEVDPHDIAKTAFSTNFGHYEFKRMPFGLRNAPSTFQRLMNFVLKDLINKICFVYLDDIIILGTSLQYHLNNIEKYSRN